MNMTTIFPQTVTCGYCGTENEIVVIGSTNAFGSMDLDMRPPPMKRDTLAQQIHQCHVCRYCAPDLAERIGPEEELAADPFRAILADNSLPRLARMFTAYAHLAETSGDLRSAVWAHRNAAWACDDTAGAFESACRCRRAALQLLDKLHAQRLSLSDDLTTDSILGLDLLRRSGRHDEVLARAADLADQDLPDILKAIARFQQRMAAASDTACYRVSDAAPA